MAKRTKKTQAEKPLTGNFRAPAMPDYLLLAPREEVEAAARQAAEDRFRAAGGMVVDAEGRERP